MDKHILRELLKNLQIIMRCPHCGKPYNLDEINLNGYNGQTYMLKMLCSNCNLPVNASITVNEANRFSQPSNLFGVNKIMNKDITPPAVYNQPKPKQKEFKKPITADELIDFHQFLKNFNGRFDKI